jgi:hypothetical protein
MTIEEKVVQILRSLSGVRQQEVLDFVEFLQTRDESTQAATEELKPLPVLTGFVPQGWKESIYHDAGRPDFS